jgi:hypothetical protein
MKKPPSPKHDRAAAIAIWVFTGLLFGFGLGIFTGHGWICLALGLVFGVLMAVFRTRPEQQIEED